MKAFAFCGLLMAGQAGADCFVAPDRLPKAVVYEDGARIEFISRDAGQWTYRSLVPGFEAHTVIVSHEGLGLVRMSSGKDWVEYTWDKMVPDIEMLEALGEIELTGRVAFSSGRESAASMVLTWQGRSQFEMGGCAYPTVAVSRRLSWDGKVAAQATLSYSPGLGVTFVSRILAPGTFLPVVSRAVTLE